ncbi:EAL domain-containing protein [Pantoea sp. FN0307]|uniref:sensor domain-containing phosphodiesterase n=1 Tax=Pantoea sp. FN0307 TaxID=3418560 RepID=UPI003CE8AE9D
MSERCVNLLKKKLTAFGLLIFFTPLAHFLSPLYLVADRTVYLCYLPYGLAIAAIYIFGRSAVVPLYLAFFITFQLCFSLFSLAAALAFAFLTPLFVSCWLIRRWSGRRWRYNLGNQGLGVRLLLLNTLAPVLTMLLLAALGQKLPVIPEMPGSYFTGRLDMFSILSLQNLMLSATLFTILFYFPLRMLAAPRSGFTFCRRARHALYGNCLSALWWGCLLAALMLLLCFPVRHMLISSYLVPLVFVIFTYGIMRFTSRSVLWLWALCCLLLMHFNLDVLPLKSIFSATFLSSAFIAFTISLLYIAAGYWKSRRLQRIALNLAVTDPVVQRLNLRALQKKLKQHPSGTLCYLYLHQLKFLGCHYGLMMKTYTKRCIIDEIGTQLRENEGVYQITCDGVIVLLQGEGIGERLSQLRTRLKQQQIFWHNQLIDIDYAFAAGKFTRENSNLYRLAGQLNYLAEQALMLGGVALLDKDNSRLLGHVSDQVLLLQKIKQALTGQDIVLFAQPIVPCKQGCLYYEVLTRLRSADELIMPDRFIPLIAEFRLSAQFDRLVVKETVAFIHQRQRVNNPPPRLAINLLPMTLTEPGVAEEIIALFQRFSVSSEAVIFEVTEQQGLINNLQVNNAIATLRQAGFRIAIDDFGTGFANYERVKHLSADIIKIDGLFVKNSLDDNIDRIIIKSICAIAQEKRVSVVAEYVETEAQKALLTELGVDYIQGWLTGQPAPLLSLP